MRSSSSSSSSNSTCSSSSSSSSHKLVNMWIGVRKVIVIICSLVKPIIIVFLYHFLSPLLTAKNQEQDDETQQCGEGDTNGRQGCSPPSSVVDITAVDDAVVERH